MTERMTLAKLREILASRGFTVEIKADGSTSLRGRREQATPALMRALAYWREALVTELRRERRIRENLEAVAKATVECPEEGGDGVLSGA